MRRGGILLCGGQSRRMGRPKAWLELGGETLLARGVRLLSEQARQVVVVGGPEQDLPVVGEREGVELTFAADPVAFRGPLQGLAVGLEALRGRAEVALARGVDGPFLDAQWFDFLVERMGAADLAIPHVGGYHHPLAAVYRVEGCLPAIQELLAAERLRPVYLIEKVRVVEVDESAFGGLDPEFLTLWNLNTPEDLERARAMG